MGSVSSLDMARPMGSTSSYAPLLAPSIPSPIASRAIDEFLSFWSVRVARDGHHGRDPTSIRPRQSCRQSCCTRRNRRRRHFLWFLRIRRTALAVFCRGLCAGSDPIACRWLLPPLCGDATGALVPIGVVMTVPDTIGSHHQGFKTRAMGH